MIFHQTTPAFEAATRLGRFAQAAQTALGIAFVASSIVHSSAAIVTTPQSGDIFIGFRKTGNATSLLVNLGQATNFFNPSLGGTRGFGETFNVQFGLDPVNNQPQFSLANDLTSTFGSGWATNEAVVDTDVAWGVFGMTDNSLPDVPIPGLLERSVFLTRARTDVTERTNVTANIANNTFGGAVNNTIGGFGGGSYIEGQATPNSTVAFIGNASDVNNWVSRAGNSNNFGATAANFAIAQRSTGANQGPTNSVLDLWLLPQDDSTFAGGLNTYLGTFTLSDSGQLGYTTAIPEPSTYLLLAMGAGFVGYTIIRKRNLPAQS